MGELLTVRNLTERFPISRTTVWRLTKQGKLPYLRLGGRIFYRSSTIDSLLDELEVKPRESGGASTSAPMAASGR